MTETAMIAAIETATGLQAEVFTRDMTGRIGSHRATFLVQCAPGNEVAPLQNITASDWYESSVLELRTERAQSQDVPLVYILISTDCTF